MYSINDFRYIGLESDRLVIQAGLPLQHLTCDLSPPGLNLGAGKCWFHSRCQIMDRVTCACCASVCEVRRWGRLLWIIDLHNKGRGNLGTGGRMRVWRSYRQSKLLVR